MIMKRDTNICEHCLTYHPLAAKDCPDCGQPVVIDSRGEISIWQLGDIEGGLLGPMVQGIREAFGYPAVIQPAFIDPRPSARPDWNGVSATVLLNQMLARRRRGTVACLCVTEENIVPNRYFNFLFGYAYLGLRAAAMGLEPLRADDPDPDTLAARAQSIAIHELGHGFGLDDQDYDGEDCVMCGDIEEDSLDTIDSGTMEFCGECRKKLRKKLRRLKRHE